MRRKNDVLLKSAFEEAFPDLLQFFFQNTDALFDLTRGFQFMDKELHELFPELEKKGGSRFADMIVMESTLLRWPFLQEVKIKNGLIIFTKVFSGPKFCTNTTLSIF